MAPVPLAVLSIAAGSWGDLAPHFAILKAARDRGHSILMYSQSSARDMVLKQGIPYFEREATASKIEKDGGAEEKATAGDDDGETAYDSGTDSEPDEGYDVKALFMCLFVLHMPWG